MIESITYSEGELHNNDIVFAEKINQLIDFCNSLPQTESPQREGTDWNKVARENFNRNTLPQEKCACTYKPVEMGRDCGEQRIPNENCPKHTQGEKCRCNLGVPDTHIKGCVELKKDLPQEKLDMEALLEELFWTGHAYGSILYNKNYSDELYKKMEENAGKRKKEIIETLKSHLK